MSRSFSRWILCALACVAAGARLDASSASPSPARAAWKYDSAKAKQLLLYAPHPTYPYAARRVNAIGAGIALLKIDEETGLVKEATMQLSTGSRLLDDNTLETLRKWRFRPHTTPIAKVPIHYTMVGVSIDVQKREKSMAEILEPFLGKGALRKAPIPQYPGFQSWDFKHGKGIYEIRDDASGQVTSVTVLKSSGDAAFDDSVQKTLRKWRFTRGPLTVELPLSFTLTPTSYRIDVAR